MQKVIEVSQYELERSNPLPSKLHGFVQAKLGTALDNTANGFNIFSELDLELDGWKTFLSFRKWSLTSQMMS
jgi:hypothetical protein